MVDEKSGDTKVLKLQRHRERTGPLPKGGPKHPASVECGGHSSVSGSELSDDQDELGYESENGTVKSFSGQDLAQIGPQMGPWSAYLLELIGKREIRDVKKFNRFLDLIEERIDESESVV